MAYSLETIVSRAKRRGFAYPGSDIYGWLANAWDLGPYGTELRRNIMNIRWKYFVQSREDVIWIDAQILMNPKVWEASWHIGWFSDPLVDCKKCKNRERADKLIEVSLEEVKKQYSESDILKELVSVNGAANLVPESRSFEQQKQYLDHYKVKCPKCKTCDWTEPKKFNLMFKTQQWIIEWEGTDIYLRPETAQWIFVNFKNITDTMRVRLPFGIAQIGKSFRNEITPGNFIFRLREFEQMELEYFIENNEELWLKTLQEWKEESEKRWIDVIGIKKENLKFREHDKDELSFYSKWTRDVEYNFPRWRGELQGIAYRTDYDLTQHQKFSGKDMQYNDPYTGKRFIPHVIEPSRGLTRAILTAMIDAYDEEVYTDGNGNEQTRIVARFHPNIAPIRYAIILLIKKDEKQIAIAKKLYKDLAMKYMCEYDDSGNIGKSYRRQDEIWTPYCITIDNQTIEDGTVTVRERDTMKQERKKIEEIV